MKALNNFSFTYLNLFHVSVNMNINEILILIIAEIKRVKNNSTFKMLEIYHVVVFQIFQSTSIYQNHHKKIQQQNRQML